MEFKPRLSAPSRDNKYYNSNMNPFVPAGYGMFQNGGNCTCYAYGRFMEEAEMSSCNLSTANAENWYLKTSDGYNRGQVPKLGAVICWEGVGAKAGHVAIVEKIESDGTITTSNSGWRSSLFYLSRIKLPYNIGSSYIFQGFIYNPTEFDNQPEPTPVVDNRTKSLQRALNNCGANLVVDGIIGIQTSNAIKRYYNTKTIIKWVQENLNSLGYNCGVADGIRGNNTKNGTKAFQRDNGLYQDGIAGINTIKKICEK